MCFTMNFRFVCRFRPTIIMHQHFTVGNIICILIPCLKVVHCFESGKGFAFCCFYYSTRSARRQDTSGKFSRFHFSCFCRGNVYILVVCLSCRFLSLHKEQAFRLAVGIGIWDGCPGAQATYPPLSQDMVPLFHFIAEKLHHGFIRLLARLFTASNLNRTKPLRVCAV